jgi:YHS domain-containing protein
MVKDPVCKMEVDESKAKFNTTYRNRTYYSALTSASGNSITR